MCSLIFASLFHWSRVVDQFGKLVACIYVYVTIHTSSYTSFSLIPHLADVAHVTDTLSRCYQLLVANTSLTYDVINKPE